MAREKKKQTRRGSPEAIAKRRAARALNTLFTKNATATGIDGRSVRRKERLLKELAEGKNGSPLKAHEVLAYATELFALGETLGSIRAVKPKLPSALTVNEETAPVIKDTQASYDFDPRAWKLLGIDIEAVMSGQTAESKPRKKRGRPSKTR